MKSELPSCSSATCTPEQSKRSAALDGWIYQLRLYMLFLYYGFKHKYSFQLRAEEPKAEKFDDLVFKYTENGRNKYIILQAKHSSKKSNQIGYAHLLNDDNGNYSLIKYLYSYVNVQKQPLFEDGEIENAIIFTNINLDINQLEKQSIKLEKIEDAIGILNFQSLNGKEPICYRFTEDNADLLKEKAENQKFTLLAEMLIVSLQKKKEILCDEKTVFHKYHSIFAAEVIDVPNLKFHEKFLKSDGISEIALKFRKVFRDKIEEKRIEEKNIEKCENELPPLENINDAILDGRLSLTLHKNFGKGKNEGWPNRLFSDNEIKEFLNHLVLAVNQPNEDELGEIVRHYIGKEFDNINTENVYHEFFQDILEWFQGKQKNDKGFYSHELVEEFFNDARRKLRFWFEVEQPVESFIGRVKELEKLHQLLQESYRVCVSGLGGIGKSELARKYVAEHSDQYDDKIIWVNAENDESINKAFRTLAQDRLGISMKNRDGNEKAIESVIDSVYCSPHFFKRKSLFIFDNVEEPADINRYLPRKPSDVDEPHVLITSRNKKWGKIKILSLEIFTEEEATTLIKGELKIKERQSGSFKEDKLLKNDVTNLAKKLQYFPLALQQAVAYINEENEALKNIHLEFNIRDYLQLYEKGAEELLKFDLQNETGHLYGKTTFTTWKLTIDKLRTNQRYGKAASIILDIMAFFAPNKIRGKLFIGLKLKGKKGTVGHAIELLKQYSIIGSEKTGKFNIHRLVQVVTKIEMNRQNRIEEVLDQALQLFENNIVPNDIDHAISCWNYLRKSDNLTLLKKFCAFPKRIAEILCIMGRHGKTKSFLKDAMKQLMKVLPHDHLAIAIMTRYLGNAYGHVGNIFLKKKNLKKALKILTNHLKHATGKMSDTQKLIEIDEQASLCFKYYRSSDNQLLNEEQIGKLRKLLEIQIANAERNLGKAFGKLNDLNQQKYHLRKALSISEKYFNEDHFEIARLYRNLAEANEDGKVKLLQKALKIFKGHLELVGNKKRDCRKRKDIYEQVQNCFQNEFRCSDELGGIATVNCYYLSTQKIKKLLEIQIAKTERKLACAYAEMGDHEMERDYLERVLPVFEKYYGVDHKEVAEVKMDLYHINILADDMLLKFIADAILKGTRS